MFFGALKRLETDATTAVIQGVYEEHIPIDDNDGLSVLLQSRANAPSSTLSQSWPKALNTSVSELTPSASAKSKKKKKKRITS